MPSTLGGRIRELRLRRGLTQEALGEKLLMRKSTISDYENDVIDIKYSVIKEIATALQVRPAYFFIEDNIDPVINEAMEIFASIKDEKLRNAALDHIRITSSVGVNLIQ